MSSRRGGKDTSGGKKNRVSWGDTEEKGIRGGVRKEGVGWSKTPSKIKDPSRGEREKKIGQGNCVARLKRFIRDKRTPVRTLSGNIEGGTGKAGKGQRVADQRPTRN